MIPRDRFQNDLLDAAIEEFVLAQNKQNYQNDVDAADVCVRCDRLIEKPQGRQNLGATKLDKGETR